MRDIYLNTIVKQIPQLMKDSRHLQETRSRLVLKDECRGVFLNLKCPNLVLNPCCLCTAVFKYLLFLQIILKCSCYSYSYYLFKYMLYNFIYSWCLKRICSTALNNIKERPVCDGFTADTVYFIFTIVSAGTINGVSHSITFWANEHLCICTVFASLLLSAITSLVHRI